MVIFNDVVTLVTCVAIIFFLLGMLCMRMACEGLDIKMKTVKWLKKIKDWILSKYKDRKKRINTMRKLSRESFAESVRKGAELKRKIDDENRRRV